MWKMPKGSGDSLAPYFSFTWVNFVFNVVNAKRQWPREIVATSPGVEGGSQIEDLISSLMV